MSVFRANKVSSTIEFLTAEGFEVQDYLPNNWNVIERGKRIGHLTFSSKTKSLSFHSYLLEDEESFTNSSLMTAMIDEALSLPDRVMSNVIGEDTITILVNYSGEILCRVNGDTQCLIYRTTENVPKNARILREALRMFKQLAEPGIWCCAEDDDGLKDRREGFFKKLGFKEIESSGFFVF